jgi:hypothetical protein
MQQLPPRGAHTGTLDTLKSSTHRRPPGQSGTSGLQVGRHARAPPESEAQCPAGPHWPDAEHAAQVSVPTPASGLAVASPGAPGRSAGASRVVESTAATSAGGAVGASSPPLSMGTLGTKGVSTD